MNINVSRQLFRFCQTHKKLETKSKIDPRLYVNDGFRLKCPFGFLGSRLVGVSRSDNPGNELFYDIQVDGPLLELFIDLVKHPVGRDIKSIM